MKITISRNCLVICEGLKSHILYFYLNIVEKIDVLEGRYSNRLWRRKKEEKNEEKMGGRTSETLCCCRYTRQLEEIKVFVLVFHGQGLCINILQIQKVKGQTKRF